jgi:hypothetical protein
MLASLGMPRHPFSGEGAGPEKGSFVRHDKPKEPSGSEQVASRLDPPCRACKIEPHCRNLSTHHHRQTNRVCPVQAASVPDVPRNR